MQEYKEIHRYGSVIQTTWGKYSSGRREADLSPVRRGSTQDASLAGRKRKQGMNTPHVRSYGGLSAAVSSTSGDRANHQQSPPPATAAANLRDYSCSMEHNHGQRWQGTPLSAPSKAQPVIMGRSIRRGVCLLDMVLRWEAGCQRWYLYLERKGKH